MTEDEHDAEVARRRLREIKDGRSLLITVDDFKTLIEVAGSSGDTCNDHGE